MRGEPLVHALPPARVLQDRLEECVYLPGEIARCPARSPLEALTPEQLDLALEQGDQRVGRTVFRPECPACNACEPVRIDMDAFRPTRAQRRTWVRNEGVVRVELGTPELTRRRVSLWNRHRRERGLLRETSRRDPVGYEDWLVRSCAPTVEVRYLLGERLVAVSLLDLGRTSANSAYHYFDPEDARLGLGVYSVMKEMELCRSLGMRWYYLGLWVGGCSALRYKTGYHPHERHVRPLDAEPSAGASWVRVETPPEGPEDVAEPASPSESGAVPGGDPSRLRSGGDSRGVPATPRSAGSA
jgi:arginyl-tRNA--protein-N-Asp/Glu arginylyltransferase